MKKEITVVAAIITKEDKILCTQRGNVKYLPYKWEFPGGKVELAETKEEALIREIKEELGCSIIIKDHAVEVKHEYDFAIINLTAYYCNIIDGNILRKEHHAIKWCSIDELFDLDWADADLPIVQRISNR